MLWGLWYCVKEESKPQSQKFSFMVKMLEDCYCKCIALLAIACCFFPLTGAQSTDPSEVTALGAIRNNLNDPTQYLNWTKGDPCLSNWRGVLCFNTTAEDDYLHVRELQLLHKNLSGNLAPELGQLTRMEILDFMWNKISGNIPKEIGKITSLKLMLLNGNELSGSLPEEIGDLPNLERIQIDQNQISGSLPVSFANLRKAKHFHMNNNSISGQIPTEFSKLPSIVHILLDNNNLSGNLPADLSKLPTLLILQLDNNNFSGASIPSSYGTMKNLLKLSLRNCSLQGSLPDLSGIPQLGYLDLSWNQLNGSIPPKQLSKNITTIDLSYNELSGSIPSNFSGLPLLQKLSLRNNMLNGSVPSDIWHVNLSSNGSLILDFRNNSLTSITGEFLPPSNSNVSITLEGNPLCRNDSNSRYCGPQSTKQASGNLTKSTADCAVQSCPLDSFYEYNPASAEICVCGAPIRVGYRLKSPGFSDFLSYNADFTVYMTSGLDLNLYQLDIDSVSWEEGPRLRMYLKFFPSNSSTFNVSEILRIRSMFTGWQIPDSDIFGPYELLNFTLLGPYEDVIPGESSSLKLSQGALAGIILGAIAVSVTCSTVVSILILRRKAKYQHLISRKRKLSKVQIKIDGVKDFTFQEMCQATDNFSNSMLVGQGGYGKVYRGILADGTEVAVKRAQEGSLQGSREFITEIELLSRLHHRNLVSLIGYCDEDNEQMLVYEFMSNGTLRDHLPGKLKKRLNFFMRLRIALGSAKGILYLHTEVDPPIFHRDIKASNILLDSKFVAKVADFGLSRSAPERDAEGSELGHVSTVVKGTPGYLDPEYFLTHKLTDKSDVYSLGIVFLELLTGMLPISHGRNIVREVNIACQSGRTLSVIDKDMGDYPHVCVERFLLLALRCCHDETDARPSMSEIVRELENIRSICGEEFSTPSVSIANDDTELITTPSSVPTANTHLDSDIFGSNFSNSDVPSLVPR